jgi:DNA repair photolyase
VRNPMNPNQISRINLAPDVVDCIVFWSKNPKPLLEKLSLLNGYAYYFQFTLNPYDRDIETKLPQKKEIIETFKKLSEKTGAQRVIWRYDPVLLNDRYTIEFHIDKFNEIAHQLKGYTEKVTFSFIDFYKKITENIKIHGIVEMTTEQKNTLAENFSNAARENNLLIDTCAEDIDLSRFNIGRAKCIDGGLIAKITGYDLAVDKDRNQRVECGCVESIDIGEYNSCLNGCVYCYANNSQNIAADNYKKHNQLSPLLIDDQNIGGIVSERKVSSNKILQKEIF